MNMNLWEISKSYNTDVADAVTNELVCDAESPELALQIVNEHNAMVGMIRAQAYIKEVVERAVDI